MPNTHALKTDPSRTIWTPIGVPFTPNRAFKRAPRLIARAKDMHYFTPEGRAVLDGTAGLWCCNTGHNRDPIVAAIQAQAGGPRLRAGIPIRAAEILRIGEPDRRAGAERSQSRVFLQFRFGGGRYGAQDRARLSQHPRRASRTRLIGASAAITASASAAFRSAALSPTAKCSAPCSPGSIICRRPIAASIRLSPKASRSGARILPTISSVLSLCTMPPPSPL